MNYYKPNIVDALIALGFSDVAGAVINTEAGYKDLKIYSEKQFQRGSKLVKNWKNSKQTTMPSNTSVTETIPILVSN